ncbi:MAG TPA: ParB N-terminal domain-containing protein [Treponema sp.]|nr:ParB N-terminal domain-containing protein [Treponema sp.]HPC70675.1 ParB N-terminal domain-containing protein [Treponema sp.]HRS03535.1 ParB N-terminal domain-containing protein [Treponema sp.]HRU27578.1 ParB N-terminal domain-containing protein [Treponema sp.]
MQIPIEDIKIKRRIRKDLGDLNALSESLRRYGQMHPILINKKNVLISGRRRLEAAKRLGWRTINAQLIDAGDELAKLEFELEENIQRQGLTNEEIQAAVHRIQKLRNPGFFRRIWNSIVRFFINLFHLD